MWAGIVIGYTWVSMMFVDLRGEVLAAHSVRAQTGAGRVRAQDLPRPPTEPESFPYERPPERVSAGLRRLPAAQGPSATSRAWSFR